MKPYLPKFIGLFLSALPLITAGQASLDSVLSAARTENRALIQARLQSEAASRSSRVGLALPNPEVQFHYLWGEPNEMGNRVDFGITQEFEFPGVYIKRSDRNGLLREGSFLAYTRTEQEVLHRTRLAWTRVVGLNRQLSLLNRRIELASEVAGMAQQQLSQGEVGITGLYHARMEVVNLKLMRTGLEVEMEEAKASLAELCGGRTIPVTDTLFPPPVLFTLAELESAISRGLPVRLADHEAGIRKLEKSIAVQEWFPKFSAGYYSEKVTGLRYQGIVTGISVPLWERSNTVKAAECQALAAEAGRETIRAQQVAQVRSLFGKREILAAQATEIRSAMGPADYSGLIKKALSGGEISIPEYFYETGVWFSAMLGLLKTEQELAAAEAELVFLAGM